MPIIRTGTKNGDRFLGTSAAEAYDGLGSFDSVDYMSSTGAITIDLGNPSNNSGNAAGDTFVSVEYFKFGRGNDTFTGSARNEQVNGYFGNDTIDGAGGDDILLGHAGNDAIEGGTGNDSIWGGGGFDTLSGGANNDRLVGDMGNDTLDGGDGNDFLQGGTGNDAISGGNGIDTVRLLGNLADYDFVYTATGVYATHARGSQVDGVEFIDLSTELLQFADQTVARPSAPPAVAFTGVALTDTGSSASDNITNNPTVTFSGTAADLDGTVVEVEVFNGTVSLGVATVSGNTWSLTAALAHGTYDNLRAVATDNSGMTGEATIGSVFVIDLLAPAASAPDLSAATDSLPVDNDDITNLQTLDLSGTAEAGSTVRLYNANTNALLATATAIGGVYAFTVTVPSGTYNFAVTAEDAAGNVGAMSSALTVIVDTQASTVVGLMTSANSITFTASDDHGPLSLAGTFAGLGAVNNAMSTTLSLVEQATAKLGTLQVQDIAGNPSNVIGLGLGTSGANIFTGPLAASANALYGFGGDDILTGGTAGDVLYGGDDNDRLIVTAGGDTLDGGAGAGDTIDFSNAASGVTFSLAGAATQNTGADFGAITWFGIENIFGGDSEDNLTGDLNANTLTGAGGVDFLTGGGGIDRFVIDAGTDLVTDLGAGGADAVVVSSGASLVATLASSWTATAATANAGSATIDTAGFSASVAAAGGSTGWTLANAGTGSGIAVSLTGGAYADTLYGGFRADTLTGGSGNDTINGGSGGDTLTGGLGTDSIDLGAGDSARDYVRFSAAGDFGDSVSSFAVDGTYDMVQFTGGLVSTFDDGNGNFSIRWAQSSGNGNTVNVSIGQANNDREGLMLRGSNGEGVTNASLGNASAVASAFNAEFVITAANGEDAILVVNDTNGNDFSVWRWIQAGGGEVGATELTLIGVFDAYGTVTTSSFGFF